MTDATHDTLFSGHFMVLKCVAALYVVAIPISHFWLPHALTFEIAFVFLVLMLFPYPIAAWGSGQSAASEVKLALALGGIGAVGVWLSPALLIFAIFAHGLWDLAKHNGAGVPFFRWYVSGCVLVDWTYAAALSVYLISGGAGA